MYAPPAALERGQKAHRRAIGERKLHLRRILDVAEVLRVARQAVLVAQGLAANPGNPVEQMDAVRECHAASRPLAIKKPGRAALGDDAFNHSIRYSVDFSQVAGLDQRALPAPVERPVRHLYHGYARTGVGRIHDPPGFGQLRGQRLFKQQMLAGVQTLDRDGCMQMMGRQRSPRRPGDHEQLAPVFIDPYRRWLGVALRTGSATATTSRSLTVIEARNCCRPQ